jgi:GNAT superfamily N-acetyltransferase
MLVELLDSERHDRAAFSCGELSLDDYLRTRASQHHRDGIATTHVLVDPRKPGRILGYYTLSAAQLHLTDLQEADRKRLPRYPVPAVRMGRLAVASDAQGKGHGELLLGHATHRALALRDQLGVRVLLVDALHAKAAAFYRLYGFLETTAANGVLYLPLSKS